MYLLDTNIISELRKAGKGRADSNVMRWFQQVELNNCYLCSTVISEVRIGILAKKQRDLAQYYILNDWFENQLLKQFSARILPFDLAAAIICAEFHIPDRSPINDAYIAAIAKANDLILVTRNTKDFARCDVRLFNPFEPN
ncbi:type II toxin-antitoxin system VapC family toxin [Mannheimia sp. AT1]|uniref:Type II toxin-antitoxin system VapC family toxin n=1 Tax=Mannheimia cairinae TaxID=3025936 RepID=A0ABT5MQ19_9PAST|nr:type II toxin-antitoxin system VapC family toxin [Mannheimia cairinae]MDD0824265.1 type II toxin-antitoxin system VapC family toxin [Mannheimia cairinae]MDD0826612.1 type II toxin-antitoxin system VapC family toxin [Mannheimia cairinae]